MPLYNEAGNVQPLARRILDTLTATAQVFELILVDDGSTDDTWKGILLAQQADSRIRAIRHPANLGQSAALFSGFRTSQGSIIATLDGDLQNDPADLPRMLAELGLCDMVCGARIARADGRLRRISSRVARWARVLILGIDFADSGCNLRVFKKRVLDIIPAFKGVHRFSSTCSWWRCLSEGKSPLIFLSRMKFLRKVAEKACNAVAEPIFNRVNPAMEFAVPKGKNAGRIFRADNSYRRNAGAWVGVFCCPRRAGNPAICIGRKQFADQKPCRSGP